MPSDAQCGMFLDEKLSKKSIANDVSWLVRSQ